MAKRKVSVENTQFTKYLLKRFENLLISLLYLAIKVPFRIVNDDNRVDMTFSRNILFEILSAISVVLVYFSIVVTK